MDSIKRVTQKLFAKIFKLNCYVSVSLIKKHFPKFPSKPSLKSYELLFKKLLGFNSKWEEVTGIYTPASTFVVKKPGDLLKDLVEILNKNYGIYTENLSTLPTLCGTRLVYKAIVLGTISYSVFTNRWYAGIGLDTRSTFRPVNFGQLEDAAKHILTFSKYNELKNADKIISEQIKQITDVLDVLQKDGFTYTNNATSVNIYRNERKLGTISYNQNTSKWMAMVGYSNVSRYGDKLPTLCLRSFFNQIGFKLP